MQKLAVNGKVSGYCVHLLVCNLQTVKSTKKVSRLCESTQWEQLFPSTCAFEMQFSWSRCPPSTKSGVGVYDDRGSSWPQVNPACLLNLPHTHYTHSGCLVGFLGCKHGWNRPNGRKLLMKRSLPDIFLTILMDLDPPTILPCNVHIVRMIFTFYSVSFWPSWPEKCCRKGSKRQFWWR